MTRHYLAEAALKKERQRLYDALETLPVIHFIQKPFSRQTLAAKLRETVEGA
jgi:hypothetical protein